VQRHVQAEIARKSVWVFTRRGYIFWLPAYQRF
jgi:hypothetical protein